MADLDLDVQDIINRLLEGAGKKRRTEEGVSLLSLSLSLFH
jgi:hypothetical protein